MRFTKMRCLFALSAGGSCFSASARADTPVMKSKTPTVTPGTAATSYIIDRSPMATSAEAQVNGFAGTQSDVGDYTGASAAPALLLTRVGRARQGAAQAGILNADTLSAAIGKFQEAFLRPGTVPAEAGKGRVKQFFLFAHKAFYSQGVFDSGILDSVFNQSLRNLTPFTMQAKQQRLQAAPNAPAVNPDAEAGVVRTEKARFDAVTTYLYEQFAKEAYPLQNDVLAVEEQSRELDKQNYFNTRLIYSNADLRTDIIGQYQTGTDNGYGAGLRFALDGYHPPPEPEALLPRARPLSAPLIQRTGKTVSPDVINALQGQNFTEQQGNAIRDNSRNAITQIPLSLGNYLLRPHFGLAANFQHDSGAGNYYDAGANASALLPSRIGNRPNAFFYGASLRYQWFQAEGGGSADAGLTGLSVRAAQISGGNGSRKGIGGSVVLAFQDNAPHIDDDGTAHLGRWHLRAGVEYAPQNALTNHDYGALFLRLRDRGAGEYTFLLGSEVNGQGFVGFNASYYFGGPKRQRLSTGNLAGNSLTE